MTTTDETTATMTAAEWDEFILLLTGITVDGGLTWRRDDGDAGVARAAVGGKVIRVSNRNEGSHAGYTRVFVTDDLAGIALTRPNLDGSPLWAAIQQSLKVDGAELAHNVLGALRKRASADS